MASELRERVLREWSELSNQQLAGIEAFYDRLVSENERQNLTHLISPADFVEGHVLDVRELFKSGALEFPAADLGSGAGIPGLLAAIIRPDPWLLIESEKQKAHFLLESVTELSLGSVRVFGERGEDVLKRESAKSIVARAVGPVGRIYGWLRGCSTWNHLILLKGPKWDEEWKEFQKSAKGDELKLVSSHAYTVGAENKRRLIVRLDRVPREHHQQTAKDLTIHSERLFLKAANE